MPIPEGQDPEVGLDDALDTPADGPDNDLTWAPERDGEQPPDELDFDFDEDLYEATPPPQEKPSPEQAPETPAAADAPPPSAEPPSLLEQELDLAGLNPAESEKVQTLRKSLLADYTKKTQEAAEQKRAVEAEREAIRRERAEIEALRAQGTQPAPAGAPATGEPSLTTGRPDDHQAWIDDFTVKHGREPLQTEFMEAMVEQKLALRMAPLVTSAQQAEQAQAEAQAQEAIQSGEAEWTTLCSEYPVVADSPVLKQAVVDKLREWNAGVSGPLVRDAFNAVVLPGIVQAKQRGADQVRQQTVASRQAAPSTPPASGGPVRKDWGSTHEEIAKNLRGDPLVQASLRTHRR